MTIAGIVGWWRQDGGGISGLIRPQPV